MKFGSLIALGVVATLIAGTVMAQQAPEPGRGGRGGGATAEVTPTKDTPCASNPPIAPSSSDWIGAGGDAAGHRYQPNPGIRAADVRRLKPKWTFTLTQGNGQPTVMGEWLWIYGSGSLYALDPKTGCVRWRTDNVAARTTPMPVKTSISPSGWALVLGLRNRTVKAFDAATGRELWTSDVLETHRSSGITGSIIVAGNQVFVPTTSGEEASGAQPNYACCSFRGSLSALDLATGRKQWQVYPITEPMRPIRITAAGVTLTGPAGAAIWSQPTLDARRGLVLVATGDSYTEAPSTGPDSIIAYEMATGRVRWHTQVTPNDNYVMNCNRAGDATAPANCPGPLGPDYDFGASPVLVNKPGGGQVVVSGQKSGLVHGMDPDTGRLLWSVRVGAGSGSLGGVEWGIASDNARVYAGSSDIRGIFDQLMRPLGKSALRVPPPTPEPGLSAVNPVSGRLIWKTPTPKAPCNVRSNAVPEGACAAGNSAAPAVMPGVVFAGDTAGWFRAYDAATGRILWEHNTAGQTYATVNGVRDQPGGGVDGNGPTIAQGTVFVTSGFSGASNYGSTSTGRNVLIAYTVDGK